MDAKMENVPKDLPTGRQIPIDFGRMYQFSPEEMCPDIRASSYANISFITCTNRDVYIDFLEMPGIKKDGKMMIPATRVYMSHSAAQQLAEKLKEILEGSYQRGDMEFFQPPSGKESDSVRSKAGKK